MIQSIQYFVISYNNNNNIYILVNSDINHVNYLQLQQYYIKYSTSHSYNVVTILHIFINNFIY